MSRYSSGISSPSVLCNVFSLSLLSIHLHFHILPVLLLFFFLTAWDLFLAYSQLLEILFRCGQQGCVNSHYFVFISGVSLPASSYCFHFCLNSHHPLFCRHLPPLASWFLHPNIGFRDTSIAEMLGTECNTWTNCGTKDKRRRGGEIW